MEVRLRHRRQRRPQHLRATWLDSRSTYSADGLDVLETLGPLHRIALANDASRLVNARAVTTTTYDEGKPDGVAYRLPTTTRTGARVVGVDGDQDVRVDRDEYGPVNGGVSGWVLRKPTKVITAAETAAPLEAATKYDDQGRARESREIDSTGSDAGTVRSVFYTAGANPDDPACGNRPEWAGQACVVRAAGAITGHDAARMVGEVPVRRVESYTRFGEPDRITETVAGKTRTTVNTYDAADRLTGTRITGDLGEAIGEVGTDYDPVSGDATTTKFADGTKLTREFDRLGRLTRYTAGRQAALGRSPRRGRPHGRPAVPPGHGPVLAARPRGGRQRLGLRLPRGRPGQLRRPRRPVGLAEEDRQRGGQGRRGRLLHPGPDRGGGGRGVRRGLRGDRELRQGRLQPQRRRRDMRTRMVGRSIWTGRWTSWPIASRTHAGKPDPTAIADQELFRGLAERLRHRLWLSSFVPTPLPAKDCGGDAPGRLDVESNLCSSGIGGSPRPPRTLGHGASDADGRGTIMDWRERREYEDMVDRLRRVVGSLPYWTVDEHDGRPVLVDVEGDEVLLRLNSQWNPNLAAFFSAFDRYRLLELVALLEVVPEGRAQRAAADLLRAVTKDLPAGRRSDTAGELAEK